MGVEFELKYGATRAQQAAIRQDHPAEEQIFQMETTYYDTPTGQFSARKCTLRRRLENGVSICTLKTPAGGFGRREWEVACDTIEAAGYESMVYFNPRQSEKQMYLEELTDYKFWLAKYDTTLEYPYAIHMWQYTCEGTVPGISGHVDLNLYFPEA